MNLGTAVVSLLLVVVVAAIVRGIAKDKRAGKNVGCGACKSCAHASSSQKTSHTNSSCCLCSSLDKLLANMNQAAGSSPDAPSSSSSH